MTISLFPRQLFSKIPISNNELALCQDFLVGRFPEVWCGWELDVNKLRLNPSVSSRIGLSISKVGLHFGALSLLGVDLEMARSWVKVNTWQKKTTPL
jgi:hypothetical protein